MAIGKNRLRGMIRDRALFPKRVVFFVRYNKLEMTLEPIRGLVEMLLL